MTGPHETWRPVAGFPAYEVSNFGRVRSLDRTVSYLREGEKRTFFLRGKILKPTTGSHGYSQVTLSVGGIVTQCCIHVLVAQAFIGPRSDGLMVLHRDGKKPNCRVSNLYYGTQSDNAEDSRRHGTLAEGERNGSAKLTKLDVRVIRRSRATQRALADRFGVRQGTISFIQRGETWRGIV